MIVLHAGSTGRSLILWGEDSERAALRPRARYRFRGDPEYHPFDAKLAESGVRIFSSKPGLRRDRVRTAEAVVELPSTSRAPVPSPELGVATPDEDAAPAGRRRWRVEAVELPWHRAEELLAEPLRATPAGCVLGPSIPALAALVRFAADLVRRGRYAPAIHAEAGAMRARWVPVLSDPRDAERVGLLLAACPEVLCAADDPSVPGTAPGGLPARRRDPVVRVLTPLVDVAVREALRGRGDLALPGADGSPVRRLADGLVSGDAPPLGGGMAPLAAGLDAWRAPVETRRSVRVRTCFRLCPPDEGDEPDDETAADADVPPERRATSDAHADEELDALEEAEEAAAASYDGPVVLSPLPPARAPWRVEFLLQGVEDPSLLVPASEVWARTGVAVGALRGLVADPEDRLLGDLGRALRVAPILAPALASPRPCALELDGEGAERFLRESVPALEAAGFGVQVPAWWKEPRTRLGLTLTVRREAGPSDPSGLLGIEGLCSYAWDVALGDEKLRREEFTRHAPHKSPHVRHRRRWIAVRGVDVRNAERLLAEGHDRGRMSLGSALRAATGLDPAPVGLPVVEVEGEGDLATILGGHADERFEALDTPAGFHGELRPYQARGLAWLAFLDRLGLGACLADDMGLGKTIELLALLVAERPPGAPVVRGVGRATLLVCPMSVVGNWQHEAARFAPDLVVHVHHGAERSWGVEFRETVAASDLVVTTYALLARDAADLASIPWRRVVLDEAQNVKNPESKQARAARTLHARSRVALTGTPVENRLSDLWSLMEFLNPGLLGTADTFRRTFSAPIERTRDEEAAGRLRRLTQPFVLRRLKTDRRIVPDLPSKQEMKVFCTLTKEQATLYEAVVNEMLARIEAVSGMERRGLVLSTLLRLKQICDHPVLYLRDRSPLGDRSGKLARTEEILEEVIAAGERCLVFTQFTELGDALQAHISERLGREVLWLHGGTPRAARDEAVARFQGPDGPPVFLLSLKAGGTGLNLTAANHVVHFDRWWNPAVEDQATDRAFRIGQRKDVQVRKLVCAGTLEERIDRMIEEKKALADRVVGTGEEWLTELSTGRLREILTLSPDAVVET